MPTVDTDNDTVNGADKTVGPFDIAKRVKWIESIQRPN